MYESYYQFQRRPFSATPDSDCMFLTDSLREMLAEYVVTAERGQGIGVLTAAGGMGKTLLCQRMARELSRQFQVALVKNANFSTRRSLLQSLMFELGQSYSGLSEQELRLQLEQYCASALNECEGIVMILDEAHLLTERLLEEVRCVTNLSSGGVPLVRVILSGQPGLEETLARPGMTALNQRIAAQHHLESMTRRESQQYIEYRVNWGGANPQQIFSDEALENIAHAADGVPRAINQLCDHTLMLAFVSDAPCVDVEHVEQALEDLRQLPLHWNERPRMASPFDAMPAKTEVSVVETVEEDDEPFDFDAYSNDDVQSIEIGGEQPTSMISEEPSQTVSEEPTIYPASMEDDVMEMVEEELDQDAISESDVTLADRIDSSEESIIAGVVPLAEDQRPGPVMFEEELVIDRYAALDSDRRERPPFAAPSQPENEITAEEPVVETPVTETLEEEEYDPQVVMPVEVSMEAETESVEMTASEMVKSRIEEVEASQIDKANIAEILPTEEELGAAILNDCLKTHQAVIDQINRLDFGDGVKVDIPSATEFDVVKLEPQQPSQSLRHDRQPEARQAEEEEQVVPKPNMRRLFTKLRRVQHER